MTQITKDIAYKNGSIKITAQMNKYLCSSFVYIKFETSEKNLLYNLLQKYIKEKTLFVGCNRINEISYSYATDNGIVINCSERKILINIANILSYLCKMNLKSKELERMTASVANYNKLHKDIMKCSVYITGKCPHIIRSLGNAGDKKIERFTTMLNNIEAKEMENNENKNPYISAEVSFNGDSRGKLDLCVMLENCAFTFKGDKVELYDSYTPSDIMRVSEFSSVMQSRLKTFLICCGTPGTPSANDEGGKQHAAKCKYILECLNALSFIVSDSHGFKHQFKDIKEVQDGVRTESKAQINTFFKDVKKLFN